MYKFLNNFEGVKKINYEGSAELFKGFKANDNSYSYLIKLWPNLVDDAFVKELWVHELRQMQVLKNDPRAKDHLVLMCDACFDDECYGIVYRCSGRDYLYTDYCEKKFNKMDEQEKSEVWLNLDNVKKNENRAIFWENILNIAKGISVLHANGFLHRNISIENIVVSFSDENYLSNFRLTGFEWVLPLKTLKANTKILTENVLYSSFNEDWYQFGELIKKILGFGEVGDYDLIKSRATSVFSILVPKEISLLKILDSLISNDPKIKRRYNVDGGFVVGRIEEVISCLKYERIESSKKEGFKKASYVLQLGDGSQLFSQVREYFLTNYGVELVKSSFLKVVAADLDRPKITIIKSKNKKNKNDFFLEGKDFFYQIIRYNNVRVDKPSWEIAVVEKIFIKLPHWASFDKQTKDFEIEIGVIDGNNKKEGENWSCLIRQFEEKKKVRPEIKSFLRGMLVCHAVDVSEYLSKIYLVEPRIVKNKSGVSGYINVSLKRDAENEKIALMLGGGSLANNFHEALANSENGEDEWILAVDKPESRHDFKSSPDANSINFSEEKFKVKLNYRKSNKAREYSFYIKNDAENIHTIKDVEKYLKHKMYFFPKSLFANYTAIVRRGKAFDVLGKNESLIDSILDPDLNTHKMPYVHEYVEGFKGLDKSKKKIYEDILQTYPNYVVQGPPGVGKTFLITTLVEQIFKDEPSSKIVLSAQGHATVQVLYNELKKINLPENLIKLDTFNGDDEEDEEALSLIEKHTKDIVKDVENSQFWADCLRHSSDLSEEMDQFVKTSGKRFVLFRQLLSSANIILTTTNSKTIETLIENNTQLDWTIMEESGKASGIELISPLLLSSKRLLIGDHKQLPPFSEKSTKKILDNASLDFSLLVQSVGQGIFKTNMYETTGLKSLVEVMDEIKRKIIENDCDETLEDSEELIRGLNEKYLSAIGDSVKYFSLFKYLVEKSEFLRLSNSDKTMGSMMTEQYRMHPNISKIISDVFYDSELGNNVEKEKYYSNFCNRPFGFAKCSDLGDLNTDKGVLWLDIKEPNDEIFTNSLEENYVNLAEISVIESVLSSLVVADRKKPSLVIVSPYRRQVEKINIRMKEKGWIKKLQDVGFDCPSNRELCKTVDSFQGGEADLVIVSLVRHNINNKLMSSLGFILDERRVNVMLSRAKHQLIIVGSLGMLKYWLDGNGEEGKDKDIENYPFVRKLYDMLQVDGFGENEVSKIVNVTGSVMDFFQGADNDK
jgi:superfamily I DNA and/or RNA helicase